MEKSPTPRVAAPNIRPFTCYEIIAMHQSEMHPTQFLNWTSYPKYAIYILLLMAKLGIQKEILP